MDELSIFQQSLFGEDDVTMSAIGGVNTPPKLKHQFMNQKANVLIF